MVASAKWVPVLRTSPAAGIASKATVPRLDCMNVRTLAALTWVVVRTALSIWSSTNMSAVPTALAAVGSALIWVIA